MSAKDQVQLPDALASVSEESDFDLSAEVAHDPSGRRYDDAYLDELANEAENLGPPQLRRGRPPLGSTSHGHSPRLSTRVPHDVDDAVRAAAARQGTTPAQWLREAIEQRLAREPVGTVVRRSPPVVRQTHSLPMASLTATDGNDGQPRLVEEQRAALMRAVSTPAFTASLERMQGQVRSIAEQVNRSFGHALAAQLEPVLRTARIQTSIGKSLRPLIEQQSQLMEPMLARITAQQQQWAKTLAVPLIANAQLQMRTAGIFTTPEFTAALQRINEIARVNFEFPNADGIDRVSELIDSGEIDATTLESAEAGVGSDADMATAIEKAAEVLGRERPRMSRKRARQVVVVWVWLMWTAALVAIAMTAPPIVGAITGATGFPVSKDVAMGAGAKFDKRFPPEDEPADD